jgi:hypothetical protein
LFQSLQIIKRFAKLAPIEWKAPDFSSGLGMKAGIAIAENALTIRFKFKKAPFL